MEPRRYFELLDTFFFILKQSWRQVSFLHVYHHVSIPAVTAIFLVRVCLVEGARFEPSPALMLTTTPRARSLSLSFSRSLVLVLSLFLSLCMRTVFARSPWAFCAHAGTVGHVSSHVLRRPL